MSNREIIMEDTTLKTYQEQMSNLLVLAGEMEVKDFHDVMEASDLLYQIKSQGEMIEEHRKSITQPINESLKAIRALFKNAETAYEKSEQLVKDKVLTWHREKWGRGENTNNTIDGQLGKTTVTARKQLVIEEGAVLPKKFYKQVLDEDLVKATLLSGEEIKGAYLEEFYSITAGKK
jgi:hypothetical protein